MDLQRAVLLALRKPYLCTPMDSCCKRPESVRTGFPFGFEDMEFHTGSVHTESYIAAECIEFHTGSVGTGVHFGSEDTDFHTGLVGTVDYVTR